MPAPVLIIAIGNESRGDDALGPLLLRHLQLEFTEDDIEFIEDFQLQVEHAADLDNRHLVLFIDAGLNTPAPYSFYRAEPDAGRTLFSHALEPGAVLSTYRQIFGNAPPPAYVLCIRGERFELGTGLSAPATAHLDSALHFLREVLRNSLSLTALDEKATIAPVNQL